MNEAEEQEIWAKYRNSGDLELRNQLIEHFLPLVKRAAERMHFSLAGKVEVDELYSTGLIGLIDSVTRYVPSRNIKFATFSAQRIRGAMLDSIRNLDWVPRLSRTAYQTYKKAFSDLQQDLGRAPSDDEMMTRLELDEKDYTKLCKEVNIATVTSIQSLSNPDNEENEDFDLADFRPVKNQQQSELKEILKKVITELPEKKQAALIMYYYDELTLKEISKVLDVTEGRVSQILSQVLTQLKTKYRDELSDFINQES